MDLDFLSPLLTHPGPWASVYVDSGYKTQDAAKQQELSARAAREELKTQGADRATYEAVFEALNTPPRRGSRPSPGRVVFATAGKVVLDAPLAASPQAELAMYAMLPRIEPVVELADENPACLVAYIDRTGADFELRGNLERRALGSVQGEDWPVHHIRIADWAERHFNVSVENTWEHNATEIAKELTRCWEETGADIVLLAGDNRERREVRGRLPERVRPVTLETPHGARAAGADRSGRLLDRDIEEARAAHTARHTADIVNRYRTERGRVLLGAEQTVAAEGIPALVEAAREHRIATLIVQPGGPDLGHQVWVGPQPDQLAARRGETRYLGELQPVAARADDALLRSATATGAEVITVSDPAEAPAGGLGALLRWPEPFTH